MYYMDREGHRTKKTTSQDKFLKFVYTHTATRVLMRPFLLPAVSRLGGKLLNTKVSAVFAGLFARTHGIDLNKYEKQKFDSYNDFFTRKIKAEERPVNKEDTVLISPCDGKVSVYPQPHSRCKACQTLYGRLGGSNPSYSRRLPQILLRGGWRKDLSEKDSGNFSYCKSDCK